MAKPILWLYLAFLIERKSNKHLRGIFMAMKRFNIQHDDDMDAYGIWKRYKIADNQSPEYCER